MSGLLDDGVAGPRAIKAAGGVTVIQDPSDALFPDLPQNAVNAGVADYAAEARKVGDLLTVLSQRGGRDEPADPQSDWGRQPA